ncbi:MAG: tetratricopeptide repeat protein [Nitrospirae bacterium]|nr:tetratricopeptide repeat protein [Nitrospirota bacterium]
MGKFAIFLLIIFVAALGYLAILNKETVTMRFGPDSIYEIPKIALILFSSALGALAMLAVIVVRDARRYIENWQNVRQQKKESRLQEYYTKGLDALVAFREQEAEEHFSRIIQEEPNHINSLLRLGDLAFNSGDIIKAKDYYIKAKELSPRNIEILFSLEKVFEAEQKWQEALRYLDNILEIDEESPLALYRKRDAFENMKRWDSLLDVQYKILKSELPEREKEREHKNLIGYKYELGRHYLESGDVDRAKKLLRAVVRQDKDFIPAYLALAEAYLRDGEVEEAEELLTRGYETTSSLVFLARLEDLFIALGEPGKIIGLYQKAVQKDPKDQKLQFFLAKLYYRLEMIDDAYETVVSMDAGSLDYPDLHNLLGNIYQRRMQYDKAAEEFKKALKLKKLLLVPYCCNNCGYKSKDWSGRCPKCKRWDTFILDMDGSCKI